MNEPLRRLRAYQREAFKYYTSVQHPALFMRMRLGKTLVAIRGTKYYKPRNAGRGLAVLVIAPTTVLRTWQKELQEEQEESIIMLTGTKEERMAALHEGYTWNLLNYEALAMRSERQKEEGEEGLEQPSRKLSNKGKLNALAFQNALASYPWDAVILDESVKIKNPKAKATKFLCSKFRQVPHKAILTGNPTPEEELDVFEQLRFLDGKVLGFYNYFHFRQKHYTQVMYNWFPKFGVRERIINYVSKRAFVLQREDVGMDQPKVYEQRTFELPAKLAKTYITAEEEFLIEYEGEFIKSSTWQGAKYTWLRQLCGGFLPSEEGPPVNVWNGLVNELVTLLKGELANEQVVVWFTFNHEIEYCIEKLRKAGVKATWATGEVEPEQRHNRFEKFNLGQYQAVLVQVALGQYGINLSAATTAIYYSCPLGNDAREQSEDRVINIMNPNAALIMDFYVKNTVSEDVYNMLKFKKEKSGRFMYLAKRIKERRAARNGKA